MLETAENVDRPKKNVGKKILVLLALYGAAASFALQERSVAISNVKSKIEPTVD